MEYFAGIVKFATAWAVDAKGGTTQKTPSVFTQEPGLAMTKTLNVCLYDHSFPELLRY